MENKLIQVAAATPRLKIGDIKYNTKEIIEIIKESKDCGLIVFPELTLADVSKIDFRLCNDMKKEKILCFYAK